MWATSSIDCPSPLTRPAADNLSVLDTVQIVSPARQCRSHKLLAVSLTDSPQRAELLAQMSP